MSCMEYKTCIRVELEDLRGYSYTQAYEYFKNLGFPEPEHKEYEDEEETILSWFMYEDKAGRIIPIVHSDSKNGNRWGIDYVITQSDAYDGVKDWKFSLAELDEKITKLSAKFNIPKGKWNIINYSWYNGGDEPIKF